MSHHPRLRFLGLALTKACEYSIFDDESTDYRADIVVRFLISISSFRKTLQIFHLINFNK